MIIIQALPHDAPNPEEVKKFIKKAFQVYKEIDETEEKFRSFAIDKIPMNHFIDSEPDINSVIKIILSM